MKYRLLQEGELIQIGDEHLDDDAETWLPIHWAVAKCTYSKKLFLPVRRPLDSNRE